MLESFSLYMIDLVCPTENEDTFMEAAEYLGYSAICFLYDEKSYKTAILPKSKKLAIYKGLFIRKFKAGASYADIPFVIVQDNDISAMKRYADAITNMEGSKDFLHQRDSGLDRVMARQMAKSNIAYCINLEAVRSNDAKLMGRIMQNITLCSKSKAPIMMASFATKPEEMRAPADIRSLGIILGMHPSAAKESLVHALTILQDHTNPKRIRKGLYHK